MKGDGRVLSPDELHEIDVLMEDPGCDFNGMLERIGEMISAGITEGRFTEKQVQHDLDLALAVAFACNNIGDYEHYCTSCEWLSRVEDLSSGCGTWFYRYAVALMYCGKPRLAMEYLSRGVDEEPAYPWCWLLLGRLRAHYGDREGANAAALAGMALVPDDPEFAELMDDISKGYSLERMEMGENAPEDIVDYYWNGDDEERVVECGAVMGIVVDTENLRKVKAALSPSGWIPDHPYCTYMLDYRKGHVLVTLTMNEAFLSKIPAERVTKMIGSLPELEIAARETLKDRGDSRPLYALTLDRRLRPMLSFGGFEGDEPLIVRFDEDLKPIRGEALGGPFVSIVLLEGDDWDPEIVKKNLESDWGIRCREKPELGSLLFEVGGNLAAYSLITSRVPDGEAEENAKNNYLWPEAQDHVRRHRSHLLVALVNHGSAAVEAATIHTEMVAAACKLPGVLGVYFQGTVVSPEAYLEEADLIRRGQLPVLDWVWIGMYRTEGHLTAYTRGMTELGCTEMETVGSDDQPEALRSIMADMIYHVLSTGSDLPDGCGVGIPDGRTIRVERSPGIAIEAETVKLIFP